MNWKLALKSRAVKGFKYSPLQPSSNAIQDFDKTRSDCKVSQCREVIDYDFHQPSKMEAETHSRNRTGSRQALGSVEKRRRQSDQRLLDDWQIRRDSHSRGAQ